MGNTGKHMDQVDKGMSAIFVARVAESEIEHLKQQLLLSQSRESELRRGILTIDDCICNDREDEALLFISQLLHDTAHECSSLSEYRNAVIEQCAEICDQQHDKALTFAGAASARISAYRASEASRNEIFVSLSRKIEKSKEAVATLDSERAANAALTQYVEYLETIISQLKEPNGH